MRDIVLTLIVGALLLAVFKHPVIGAYLWAWLSVMNPHKLTYGFAYQLPFAAAAAAATMVMFAVTKQRAAIPLTSVTALWLMLIAWMSVTSFFALNDQAEVLDRWIFVMKIHVMLAVTLMLVTDAAKLRVLVAVVALSLAFYGIKGGVFTVMTGGSARVWGPPGSLMAGNNELAIGLVMVVPFLYWIRQTTASRLLRHAMTASIVLCAFSILGTQSRGALLALLAIAFFLGLKSAHPVRVSLSLGLLVGIAILFMPDTWTDRMNTIATYQEDLSAMSRIWTWQTLWNVAVDRPFVGAGFRADTPLVFAQYAPKGGEWEVFEGRVWVAHSIYFQMLGEHGFVGLGLFLALWVSTWVTAGRTARRAAQVPEFAGSIPLLMHMTQVSMLGYAVGGAFLSLAYLDIAFYLMGFVIIADRIVQRRTADQAEAVPSAHTAALVAGQPRS